MTKTTELAWAAGFFDGEGGTYSRVHRDRFKRLRTDWMPCYGLKVTQIETSTLKRFQKAVGCGKINGPYQNKSDSGKSHPRYMWVVSQVDDCLRVIDLMWPYLSTPKKRQIQQTGILKERTTNVKRGKSMGAVRFTKGDKIVTPEGNKGTVHAVETIKTGKPGRPPVEVTVEVKSGLEVYSPSDLQFV